MFFPQLEKEAAVLKVILTAEPLPDKVNGMLLSRCGGGISVVSDKLPALQREFIHAVNLGSYAAIIADAPNKQQYAYTWAKNRLGKYAHELDKLQSASAPLHITDIPLK